MYIATVISVIVTTVDIIHCGPSTGAIAVSSLGAAPAAATGAHVPHDTAVVDHPGYADGFSPSGDALRSPRALTLLQWYAARVDSGDAKVSRAISRFVDFILDPAKAAAFGVMQDAAPTKGGALVTGFVGLALADLVAPWVTFGPI